MRPTSLFIGALVWCVLASFASAFSVGASAHVLSITSCTSGYATVYVAGAPPGSSVSFAVDASPLQVSLDQLQAIAVENQVVAAQLSVVPRACMQGRFPIQISVKVCDVASCTVQPHTLWADVAPCQSGGCGAFTQGFSYTDAGTYPAYCASGSCTYASKFEKIVAFAPTHYAVKLERASIPVCIRPGCHVDQIRSDGSVVFIYSVKNTGSAGDFSLQVVPDANSPLFIVPSTTVFSLSPAETVQLHVNVRPLAGAPEGTYKFTVKVLHQGVQVSALTQWVQIASVPQPTVGVLHIDVPTGSLSLDGCALPELVHVRSQLRTTHAPYADVRVQAHVNGVPSFDANVRVAQDIVAEFPLSIPSSQLRAGVNHVAVAATGAGLAGAGGFTVFVSACPTPSAKVSAQSNATDGTIVVLATIVNDGERTLSNVTGDIVGLPSGWSYASSRIDSIAPGASAVLRVDISAADGQTPQATLLVKSNGKLIATHALGTLSRAPSGFTGFVIAASSSWLVVMAALALAGIGLFLFARRNEVEAQVKAHQAREETEKQSTEEYVERMRKIRSELEHHTPTHPQSSSHEGHVH